MGMTSRGPGWSDPSRLLSGKPTCPVAAILFLEHGRLDQRVRAAAAQAGVSFSALVREWIELGLTEMEDDSTVGPPAGHRARRPVRARRLTGSHVPSRGRISRLRPRKAANGRTVRIVGRSR